MADLYDGLQVSPTSPPPPAPKAPPSLYEGLLLAPTATTPAVREASGLVESIQAGLQGSAPGLAWRGRMPELVMNPETSKWWERAASSFAHVGAELPLMIGGAVAGGAAGAPTGPVGSLLGAGFGMGVVPATIRQSLIEAYKSGEIKTAADWFNAAREVATQALKEGGINAAAMGMGGLAKAGIAVAGGATAATAKAIGVGTATSLTRAGAVGSEVADLATQIATMVAMPAALEQRMPSAQEFIDAAILVGGLKVAHVTATRMMTVYEKTGKTPAEQVADAQADPKTAAELAETTGTTDGIPIRMDRLIAEAEMLGRGGIAEAPKVRDLIRDALVPRGTETSSGVPIQFDSLIAAAEQLGRGGVPEAPRVATIIREIKERGPYQGDMLTEASDLVADTIRLSDLQRRAAGEPARTEVRPDGERIEVPEKPGEALSAPERAELEGLRTRMASLEERVQALPTRQMTVESSQRVYDDVVRQVRDADDARRGAGLQPLGDDHAAAVAALVRARVRTRAARLGVLPEAIYNERPLQIRDETAAALAAEEAAIPAAAPRFEVPEVDMFGAPVEAPRVPRLAVEGMATVEVPLEGLSLSKDVPQFKAAAAADTGVVQALGGRFDRTGVGPIQVWERLDGSLEVISGRHRLDLARRSGEETIPAQVHREADGFDARQAAMLDAMLNIREEQGSTADYVQFFQGTGITKDAADAEGLLARAKGRNAFAISQAGTPDLVAAHRAGLLSDEAALSISVAAPGDARLQALGMQEVANGKSTLMAVNTMKAVGVMAGERAARGDQGDIFGLDDSAMIEATTMAKRAGSIQRGISEQINAVAGAAKRPELAKKMGVDVADPAGIQKRIIELRQEQALWDSWPTHPELVARLRAPEVTGREGDLAQGPVSDTVPLESGPFTGVSRQQFLGDPKITKRSNAADLKPKELKPLEAVTRVPFNPTQYGGRFEAKYAPDGAAVFEGDKVIASYNFGDTLVVDKKYRRLGIAEELVYQWRTRNPEAKPAGERTAVAQAVQEKVWDRIQTEASRNVLRQEAFELKPETPAELKARDEEAAAQAKRILAQEAAVERATRGKSVTVDQADLFNTQGTLLQDARGSYGIAENLIKTLEGADKSTVVHELGHSWLEEMKLDAGRKDAPEQLRQDYEIIRRELGIGEGAEISRSSHEQFARSVERYLADGEAPSLELRTVFERFREWLLDIYRDLRNLNVTINPEMKAVLDRMLATDEEIAAARDLGVPRAYVAEAAAQEGRKIVPGFKAEQISMEPYADEIPKGPGAAPDDSHINYAYINSPTDVKLTMQRMAEIDQANIQKQRGGTEGVKSWADANAEQAKYVNDILGGSEDTLRLLSPRDPEAPGPDVKLGILKKLAVGAAKDSARLRDVVLDAGHDATVRQQLEYMGSIERARMIQAEFLGERAGVARALNALKDVTEGSGEIARMLDAIGYGEEAARTMFQEARTPEVEQAMLRRKLDEILLNYKGKTVLDIARLHKEIGTLKGTFKFAAEVTKATKWEMVVEGWKAGLLSGPVTHTTNLFGTGAFQALRAPVDALAAVIGMARGASPGMGESDRASMSEALARVTGMLGGVQDGVKVAVATFRLDDPTGKTEAYRTAIPGRAGELIRIPLRMMGAEDALVTTMYKRGELKTLSIRQAFDEQMNPGTREFAERVDHLMDSPTPEMVAEADAAATRMTFNAPLGEKGVALQLFVNKWNLQWMIPFIRTPINITKEVARMSPFAPLVGEWRADIAKGGVARDRAIAEASLGAGLMALTVAYTFAGNVSGGGSPDPGKNRGKAGVEQPYSIKIGDKWYEYARIQPTGTLMGLAADMAVVWDHMTDDEKDKIPKLMAMAFSNAVTNQTFLQGITNVVQAMSEPARFGPKFLQSLAGSMVPNVIGQPTAMADPVVREVNGMLESIQSRIPGLRQDLLPKRDWLGEPVESKERVAGVAPVRVQPISDDKVRLEAARLDISMAAAPKKTHIGKGTGKLGDVELTPEERNKFQEVGGKMAHQILANIVNSEGYDQIPDLVKRRIFSRVLSASHQVAAVAALPMAKRMEYLQQITERVAAELAPPEQ